MSAGDKLTIHKLVFQLEVDDKDSYKHFADRFSRLCSRKLPRKIDQILKKHNLPKGKLVINKLSLNLGNISPHRFEDTIVNAVCSNLDSFLRKYSEEIEKELSQAKFQSGRTFVISHRLFKFESEVYIEKPVSIEKEIYTSTNQVRSFSLSKNFDQENDAPPEESLRKMLEQAQGLATTESVVSRGTAGESDEHISSLQDLIADTAQTETDQKLKAVLDKQKIERQIGEAKGTAGKKEDSLDLGQLIKDKDGRTEEGSKEGKVRSKGSQAKSPQKASERSLNLAKVQNDDPSETELNLSEQPSEKKRKKRTSLLSEILDLDKLPQNLPPKALTELDKAFLYYIRYGRLPSNIKYELGMKMLDVFNVNQRDIRFFKELKKHIARDEVAKERLMRLTDKKNKDSLVRKSIFERKEVEEFDPRIPKAFEDYLIALVLERDVSDFSTDLQRYNLNDMIRFFYADHPQKLKSILSFLLLSDLQEGSLSEKIERLFSKLGKSSIVKIIATYVRKAGHVNKALNRLNKSFGRSVKAAHAAVFLALLKKTDPLLELKKDGFLDSTNDPDVIFAKDSGQEIRTRVFSASEPVYELKEMSEAEIINYFLTHGTLPHTSLSKLPSLETLSFMIQKLTPANIVALPYFKDKLYEKKFNYQSIGLLSKKAIEYLITALAPSISQEVITKYMYFSLQINDGVPQSFQKTFALHFALKNKSVSYLEEMINFWKETFGDADSVIKRRWKVSEEISGELNTILHIKEESLADQLKVDFEFETYSKDISVKNAGLVILWPFFKPYFKMLDLLNAKGDFRSMTERARACHLLQYLAVKQAEGEEFYYPLNKILTGYPIDEPLPFDIKMTEKEKDVSTALLKNVVKQWNALKGASVDALRGSFLIRDGVLTPSTNGWLLTVEKKAYDILLEKLPWGIGMIKLSWAPKVLSVEWERNIT